MSSEATENLFLLEFLVDSLELAPQCECASPPGETCVAFTFLDNAPLEICEEDFSPAMRYGQDNARLKSGKSCLFSLTADQVAALSAEFDVTVSVLKKMQSGWLPDKIQVGAAVISIANLFTEMIQSIQESTAPESPTSKTLKDVFEIFNTEGTQVGKIGVYIRMSCFGKLIVTQFQMNFDDKSVLFKDKEGKSLYRYKKAPRGKEHKIDDMGGGECDSECPYAPCATEEPSPIDEGCAPSCPGLPPPSPAPCPALANKETAISRVSVGVNPDVPPCIECMGKSDAPCVSQQVGTMGMPQMGLGFPPPMGMPPMMPGMGMPGMGMPFPSAMTPCNECGMLPDPPCMQGMMGGYGGMQQGLMGCSPSCDGIQHLLEAQQQQKGMQNPPGPPPGNYQEIGATLGTNKLTIRVHKNSKVEPCEGNPAKITNNPNQPNQPNQPNKTDNKVSGGDSCTCCPGATAERQRKKEQMGQQQPQLQTQAYNMGLGIPQGDSRIPFSFKMGCMGQGAGGAAGKNVMVQPPTTIAADGTQFTEISDPDKDLFILRIGKKSEGIDKKNNLELELCTPRAPDYKPQPKQETRDTQFDESDLPEGGGGKKGDKKGKGKDKGKKGKKK
ncbi:uncharacterized protein LOC123310325 isoform X1 [Coccinella septempunctata]|uniref:uncharacterized protein LOC123310325 isoform X1 n=1 Tax=Coccinella septempunctata TaxID=41139 RepID=UPI001D07C888|nr:uncharacterized protein LOC123310325 isoform X1 [Coccinella septempunctata]